MLTTALGVGCSSEFGSVELVPGTGVVKLDGKPVGGVSLTLVPQEGVKGRGGYAVSADDGSFTFQTDGNTPGVPAGSYRILLQKYAMPDGSPIPPNASAADAGVVNKLPPIYSDPERSPAFVTLPSSASSGLTIDMKSRAR